MLLRYRLGPETQNWNSFSIRHGERKKNNFAFRQNTTKQMKKYISNIELGAGAVATHKKWLSPTKQTLDIYIQRATRFSQGGRRELTRNEVGKCVKSKTGHNFAIACSPQQGFRGGQKGLRKNEKKRGRKSLVHPFLLTLLQPGMAYDFCNWK